MYKRLVFITAAIVVLLDQVTKSLAVAFLENKSEIDIFGRFVGLSFARNPGAAFSFGTGMTFVFTALAVAVSVIVARTARTLTHPLWAYALGGLLGGALGNLGDRLFRSPSVFQGHVVDFIRFPNYPLFNIADSAIVFSAIVIVLLTLRNVEMSSS